MSIAFIPTQTLYGSDELTKISFAADSFHACRSELFGHSFKDQGSVYMDYNNAGSVALAYWGSNLVGLIFLIIAYKWTRVARLMFVLLFGYAAWINFSLSYSRPEVYLDYSEHAIGLYSFFITGWFSEHITEFVSVIAAGQAFIAAGMLLKDRLVVFACVGVVIFLAGIAPLGYYAAFPFSITVSLAAILILKNDCKHYLWMPLPIRRLHRLRTA